jgi:hypothetical protein
MKKIFVVGALGLAMAVTGSQLIAAPGDKKAGKGKRNQNGPAMQQIKRIEQVLGTPLTAEQKTAVQEATKSYNEALAKAVGLTLDEWNAKQKAFREKQAAEKKAKPAN